MARKDDEEAPWLAAADGDVAATTAVPRGRLIGGVVIFLLLLTLVLVGIYLIVSKKQDGATGVGVTRAEDAPLIAADRGPYKIPPTDAGGMSLEGQGGAIFCAGDTQKCESNIDPDAAPEAPAERPGSEPVSILPEEGVALPKIPPAPASVPPAANPAATVTPAVATPVTPKPAQPKPKPTTMIPLEAAKPLTAPVPAAVAAAPVATAAAGTTVQLGAFSSQAKAEQAWTSLSSRYAYLAPLEKRIEGVETATGKLYRLRAAGSTDAASVCARLKVAGEACVVTR